MYGCGRVLVKEPFSQTRFIEPEQRRGVCPNYLSQDGRQFCGNGCNTDTGSAQEVQLQPETACERGGEGRARHAALLFSAAPGEINQPRVGMRAVLGVRSRVPNLVENGFHQFCPRADAKPRLQAVDIAFERANGQAKGSRQFYQTGFARGGNDDALLLGRHRPVEQVSGDAQICRFAVPDAYRQQRRGPPSKGWQVFRVVVEVPADPVFLPLSAASRGRLAQPESDVLPYRVRQGIEVGACPRQHAHVGSVRQIQAVGGVGTASQHIAVGVEQQQFIGPCNTPRAGAKAGIRSAVAHRCAAEGHNSPSAGLGCSGPRYKGGNLQTQGFA